MSFAVINRVFQKKSLICPQCRGHLTTNIQEGLEVEYCLDCRGTWVDIERKSHVLKVPSKSFSIDELKHLRRFYQPLGKLKSGGYLPCPICRQLMHRKNWGSYSGVIVDFCGDHGTWFQEDELEKVREYVALGGVEYEKWHKVDQRLNEMERKIRFL